MPSAIVQDDKFKTSLSDILNYIALDSKNRASNFKNALKKNLDDLIFMPYKFRKSIYFDNKNIRDFIFKGYCITYVIDIDNNQIILLDIFKWRNR